MIHFLIYFILKADKQEFSNLTILVYLWVGIMSIKRAFSLSSAYHLLIISSFDFYCIQWVVVQYCFACFYAKYFSPETMRVWSHASRWLLCLTDMSSPFIFLLGPLFYFPLKQEAPGSSCIFSFPNVQTAISPRTPGSFQEPGPEQLPSLPYSWENRPKT